VDRVVQCYVASLRQISHLLQPDDIRRSGSESDRTGSLKLTTRNEALAWLQAEQANLVALTLQAVNLPGHLASSAVSLARALYWPMKIRATYRDWESVDQAGLEAARSLQDTNGVACLLTDLADVVRRLNRTKDAETYLAEAVPLFEALDDPEGLANCLNVLANLQAQQGRWPEACVAYEQASVIYQQLGDRRSEAVVNGNLSLVASEMGDLQAAADHLVHALEIFRETRDRHAEAQALVNLGGIMLRQRQWSKAMSYATEASEAIHDVDDVALLGLARGVLGEACRGLGDPAQARLHQEAALKIATETGDEYSAAEAMWRTGLALKALDQPSQARACWRIALGKFERLGAPEADQVRLLLDESEDGR
jgi:tetratricopeptide (TPR) repeat protein